MRKDATLWVNLGDSYAGSGKGPTGSNGIGDQEQRQGFTGVSAKSTLRRDGREHTGPYAGEKQAQPVLGGGVGVAGVKPKSLLLIPERFAIAMQDAGWIVRSRIAWCKKSAMPESVRDRPTSAWEHIFMFSRSARYFYDAEAVAQPSVSTHGSGNGYGRPERLSVGGRGQDAPWQVQATSSLRNFWLLGPEPSSLNHYASFPTEIPKRCILAGTSQRGVCPKCRASWVRVVEREGTYQKRKALGYGGPGNLGSSAVYQSQPHAPGDLHDLTPKRIETTGWAPSCSCDAGDPVPATVLDPFLGSGTTALVADRLERNAIGVELNPEYARMAEERIRNDAGFLADVTVTAAHPEPVQIRLLGEAS